jgi:SAM-dependent methyltransferase
MAGTLARLNDHWTDFRLGVRTGGVTGIASPDGEIGHYSTIHYREIRKILDRLDLRPHDVFVDVGSGKGRVLSVAVRYGCEVMGVEYNTELAEIAQANLRGRAVIHPVKAEEFDYNGVTAAYVFAPVGPVTMGKVLPRLGDARIAFVNPTPAHVENFDRFGYEIYDRWESRGRSHPVLFFKKL